MSNNTIVIFVARHIPLTDADQTLHVAFVAVEALEGEGKAAAAFRHVVHRDGHAFELDGGTDIGVAIAKVFTHMLRREFGDEACEVWLPGRMHRRHPPSRAGEQRHDKPRNHRRKRGRSRRRVDRPW